MIVDNWSFTLGERMGATKMSKFALQSQPGSLICNFCWQKVTDQMKSVRSQRCNTHTLYHSVKDIIPKIMYSEHIPHYDATKKATLNKLLHSSGLTYSQYAKAV